MLSIFGVSIVLYFTVCFIQKKSSGSRLKAEDGGGRLEGWRFLLDETDCSGKFLRYFARLYYTWFYNFSWLFLCMYLKYDSTFVKSFF